MPDKSKNHPGILLVPVLVLSATLLVPSGCESRNEDVPFEAGAGRVEITPPVGHPSYRGVTTAVNTPLYARALVFKQGETRGALVICDVIGIPRDLSRIVREQASQQTGIPFQSISVTATHTHTGPAFRRAMEEYGDRESSGELTAEDGKSYIATLIDGVTRAIAGANEQAGEVEMVAGIGHESGISFNRRTLMSNGKVRFNGPYPSPKMLHTVGPIDPDVHFIFFRPAGQEEFTISLSVFANHLDTHGYIDFSADYPFYLGQYLKESHGQQLVSFFGTGTCGNINHIDRLGRTAPDPPVKKTEVIGQKLAGAIREALPDARQLNPGLKILSKTIYLPLQDFSEKELEWALDEDAGPLYNERPFLVKRRRMKILSLERMRRREAVQPVVSGEPWMLPVEIHIFRLDERTAIVTLPGEVFVELGLDLKKRSPFSNTMVIELANADIAYVPTRDAFMEGDYEALNSRLIPGSGEKMVETALQMLWEVK
jgi:hypothetical protein